MTTAQVAVTTKKDWTSDQEVRWCPGCGDYGILLAVQQLMPELGVAPENTVIVGARSIDETEKQNIRDCGATVYTMRDVDERGLRRVFEEAIRIAEKNTAGIHVSFDLDVVDPQFAPGTGTPVRGGISYREAHLAMEILSDRAHVVALDLVEVNPVLDTQNQTAKLAVELALSLLGRRIF